MEGLAAISCSRPVEHAGRGEDASTTSSGSALRCRELTAMCISMGCRQYRGSNWNEAVV